MKSYISYIGLANIGKDSGTSVKSREKLNTHSDRLIKTLLRISVLVAIKYNPEVRGVFERKFQKDGHKGKAVVTASRKLAKQIWYCGKTKQHYKPQELR